VGQQPAAFRDVGSVIGMYFSPVSGPLAGQASDGQEERPAGQIPAGPRNLPASPPRPARAGQSAPASACANWAAYSRA